MFEISALKEKKISELQEIASELGIKKNQFDEKARFSVQNN